MNLKCNKFNRLLSTHEDKNERLKEGKGFFYWMMCCCCSCGRFIVDSILGCWWEEWCAGIKEIKTLWGETETEDSIKSYQSITFPNSKVRKRNVELTPTPCQIDVNATPNRPHAMLHCGGIDNNDFFIEKNYQTHLAYRGKLLFQS